jgi:diacylglycerol kinase family enzyme
MTGGSDHATGDDPGQETGRGHPIDEGSGGPGAGAPWVGIVANRGSGVGRGRRLVDELVSELRRLHFPAEVAWTLEARSALVRRAARGSDCRCLVAVGGDGTVSALINERPRPPLTVMPAGTENLVAHHFGLRRDPHGLARTIAAGKSVPVDIAQADGRRFLLMAGFGFDADVVTRHHRGRVGGSGRIRPTNRMAYVQHILRSSVSYRFPTISVRIVDPGAEEVLRGTTVFIFNLPRYALGLPFVPVAREDDGWLDLVVFRHPGPFRALYYLWKVVCGIHLHDPSVFHRRVRKAVVTAHEPIPVQLDGDPGGYVLPRPSAIPADGLLGGHPASGGNGTIAAGPSAHRGEWTVEVLPSALSMLVPARRGDRTVRAPLAVDGPA